MQRVNLVVTCTERKRRFVPDDLRLGSLERSTLDELAEAWVHRLEASSAERTVAAEMYAGDHWAIASSLPQVVPSTVEFVPWIASAGYGLIDMQAPLVPYAATFARGHADSIGAHLVPANETEQRWWEQLCTWSGPGPVLPRSLTELASSDPDAVLLLVASASYLRAFALDAEQAAGKLARPQLLTIISVGSRNGVELAEWTTPGDARLRTALGGTLQTLNVRLARELLTSVEKHDFDRSRVRHHIDSLLAQQPELQRYERAAQSDDDVKRFVRSLDPGTSRSRALRLLRDGGYACEQKRFAQLFDEAVGDGR